MQAFADIDLTGIWLTALKIDAQSHQYHLEGVTQKSELLPIYIERLSASSVLKEASFSLFDVKRDNKDVNSLQFVLSGGKAHEFDSEEAELTEGQ